MLKAARLSILGLAGLCAVAVAAPAQADSGRGGHRDGHGDNRIVVADNGRHRGWDNHGPSRHRPAVVYHRPAPKVVVINRRPPPRVVYRDRYVVHDHHYHHVDPSGRVLGVIIGAVVGGVVGDVIVHGDRY